MKHICRPYIRLALAVFFAAFGTIVSCRTSQSVSTTQETVVIDEAKAKSKAFEPDSWADLTRLNRYEKLRLFTHLSFIAYDDFSKSAAFARTNFGMTFHPIDYDDLRAIVLTKGNSVVVSIRGTANPENVVRDIKIGLEEPEGPTSSEYMAAGVGSRYHHGFTQATDQLFSDVLRSLEAYQRQRAMVAPDANVEVYLTGHSLGGAIAELLAWRLDRHMVSVRQIVTFGAPKIGNCLTVRAFEKAFPARLFRFVRAQDPVPMLPPEVPGLENTFCRGASEIEMSRKNLKKLVESNWDAMSPPSMVNITTVTSLFNADLSQHSLVTYLAEFD